MATFLELVYWTFSSSLSHCIPHHPTHVFVHSVLPINQNNKKHGNPFGFPCCIMEVPPRFELGNKGFADLRLTAWLWHRKKWSGRRGSDSRPQPWQGCALPTELLPHSGALGRNRTTDTQIFSLLLYLLSYQGILAMRKGLEPSTSSVTGWHSNQLNYRAECGGNNRARTYDPLLVRQMLSQLSYAPIAPPSVC